MCICCYKKKSQDKVSGLKMKICRNVALEGKVKEREDNVKREAENHHAVPLKIIYLIYLIYLFF